MLEAVLAIYLIGTLATFLFLADRLHEDSRVILLDLLVPSLFWPVFLFYQFLAYLQSIHNRLS